MEILKKIWKGIEIGIGFVINQIGTILLP